MKIKTVAILGAGAVGAYFIWGLSKKPEARFCILASGERALRLRRDGILINGSLYRPNIKSPQEAYNPDLLLVSTKYDALEESLEDIRAVVGPNTMVLSLLNGIGSEERIAAAIGGQHLVYSLMRIASVRTGNQVTFLPEQTAGVFYGEKNSPRPSERTLALDNLFDGTGIRCHFSPDIIREQWLKYAGNVSQNLPQALLNVGAGAYEASEHLRFLAEKLWWEVAQVASAHNVQIDPHLILFSGVKPTARYSTLQDLDAGRRTEIEMLAGDMIRMGNECGIPVPYCEYTYHLIRALEEKNDGKFSSFNLPPVSSVPPQPAES